MQISPIRFGQTDAPNVFQAVDTFKSESPNVSEPKVEKDRLQGWTVKSLNKLDTGELLGRIYQAPHAKTHVQFVNGKMELSAVVTTPTTTKSPGQRYIMLPGSTFSSDDTIVFMPGQRIKGKETVSEDIPLPQKVQTVTDQAILQGAGLASRFFPVSGPLTGRSKPAVPLGEHSIARQLIEQLKEHGFKKVIVPTYYIRDSLKKDLKDVKGIDIQFLDMETPSGSADTLRLALKGKMLDKNKPTFIVAGDHVLNASISDFMNAHEKHNAAISIWAKVVDDADISKFGIIQTDEPSGKASGNITAFHEKPTKSVGSNLASAGIYVISPEAYEHVDKYGADFFRNPPKDRNDFDWGTHFLPHWLSQKGKQPALTPKPVHMWAEVIKGKWFDVGNATDYLATARDLAEGRYGEARAKAIQPYYKDGVLFWPSTKQVAEKEHVKLAGNIIVASSAEANANVNTQSVGKTINVAA